MAQVQDKVAKLYNIKPTRATTLHVLKSKLGMSYRKIKRVPF